jgi:hypothetical protein
MGGILTATCLKDDVVVVRPSTVGKDATTATMAATITAAVVVVVILWHCS